MFVSEQGEVTFSMVVVDDFHTIRTQIRRGFEATGVFQVVAEAENGRDALEAAISLDPDVVMLDLSMPVCGGLEILQPLRDFVPSALIVILSAIAPDVLGKAAWSSGADLYLEKATPMSHIVGEVLTELHVRRSMAIA